MYQDSEDFKAILDHVNDQTSLEASKNFMHHGQTNLYDHSVSVAYLTFKMCKYLKIKKTEQIVIGALLHDYFLYDWHIPDDNRKLHGISHPSLALDNAKRDMTLSLLTEDVISKHMFPLTPIPPKYLGSWVVCLCDKIVAVQEICFNIVKKTKHYFNERSFI